MVTSGGSKSIGSGVKIDILEEPLVKVDIDRLGRRKQDSRRWVGRRFYRVGGG